MKPVLGSTYLIYVQYGTKVFVIELPINQVLLADCLTSTSQAP